MPLRRFFGDFRHQHRYCRALRGAYDWLFGVVSKDLVGLFFARTITELMVLVDECTEPEECEYVYLPPGSIYWSGPAIRIPVRILEDDTGEDEEIPWSGATISESWWDAFYVRHRWMPIDPERAAELKQRKPARKRATRKSAKVIPFRSRKPDRD